MNSENRERFKIELQAGKAAFEGGHYRQSVQHLEKANALMARASRPGGEAQIWLVMAYEAAGQSEEAIALCKQLERHPDLDTRQQGKNLLYILQAPRLQRPAEWMTQIPDLATITDTDPAFRRGSNSVAQKPKPIEPEPLDLSQVNTQDNQFVWVALGAIALILGGLVWFSF